MLRWVLRSRNIDDFNARHPAVVMRSLLDETVADGEIVEPDASGGPSFRLLQNHGSEIKSVLIFSALGNDQSDIVVLFTGARLFSRLIIAAITICGDSSR